MTEPRLLQNFSGGRAIVVTDRASSLDILTTSLDRLGVTTNPAYIVESVAAIDLATLQPDRDVIFIDVDISDAAVLPRSAIGRLPPAPKGSAQLPSGPERVAAIVPATTSR